ncbi:uncharacterized protein MYCGRDRAFT_111789 [Zymoseptoria tritici IPO323]|uniref:Uncharacterized protein n=1 Tax=Zymoseptoria tritici (strain CBS 115943 / IPO323) TaxID=336722 RepID=F9XRW4_ZYMTI|nr:uncharacterized protein MYCGRDRAFT_111789 [Zymoseptoria tritici IPO323]EGP81987.1 hypothetical protein MYCGRDRAFT_111789 [Zymoseptoria tritici IPO323]
MIRFWTLLQTRLRLRIRLHILRRTPPLSHPPPPQSPPPPNSVDRARTELTVHLDDKHALDCYDVLLRAYRASPLYEPDSKEDPYARIEILEATLAHLDTAVCGRAEELSIA